MEVDMDVDVDVEVDMEMEMDVDVDVGVEMGGAWRMEGGVTEEVRVGVGSTLEWVMRGVVVGVGAGTGAGA